VAGDGLSANDYLDAARQYAVALLELYRIEQYALTVYVSGLAAECLFRAFRAKKGLPFRSDHALHSLAREAGFPELIPGGEREKFDAALASLIVGWQNAHRFRSKEVMLRFMKSRKLDRKIKGDVVKERARRLCSSAVQLISLGERQWMH
jgi:hypothetical protein